MHLILIRHGQTPSNVGGIIDTRIPGPGLTDRGLEQAAAIPAALADRPVDAIFVSRMVRTHLTAAPLAADRGIAPVERPGLHEIQAGDLEMSSDYASVRTYMETAFAWGMGDLAAVMPGADDGSAFFGRYDADVAHAVDAVGPEGTAVIVSHGAAIRVWVAGRATNVEPSFAGSHELDNTGVVELEGNPTDGWVLTSWQGTPVGGAALSDRSADDPTGETLGEARADEQAASR